MEELLLQMETLYESGKALALACIEPDYFCFVVSTWTHRRNRALSTVRQKAEYVVLGHIEAITMEQQQQQQSDGKDCVDVVGGGGSACACRTVGGGDRSQEWNNCGYNPGTVR